MKRIRRSEQRAAELDITAFLNLMIVLVPVLLMSMVFSHLAVLELQLPKSEVKLTENNSENKQLELVIRESKIELYYPSGYLLKIFPLLEGERYDFKVISAYLQKIKQTLLNNDVDKKDIIIMPEEKIDYQTIISVMDAVRSYKAVVVASVVDAELFPEISFADAPHSLESQSLEVVANE